MPSIEHARGARRVVEEHARDVDGEQTRRERGVREHGADVRVGELMSDLTKRTASGLISTAPRPSAAASAVMNVGRRRQQDRRALSAQRADEWRAALEQRETGGDELLRLELVDAAAVRGEREWEE